MALHLALQGHPHDLPPLKAAQISFVGPVTETAQFHTEVLRKGKSVTQIGADARANDALALRAAFIFGTARPSKINHVRVERPDVDGHEHYASLTASEAVAGHFKNFDIRFVGDARPASAAATPELLAWVRLLEPDGVRPEVAMLALGDCLPPAAMAVFTEPAPISSMTWSVDLPRPAAPSTWFLQRSRSLSANSGYSFQSMEMWDEHGNLVLLGTQTVAIFT